MSDITSMAAYEYGREAERERIIALIETEATIYADALLDPAEVIALIKGEHND